LARKWPDEPDFTQPDFGNKSGEEVEMKKIVKQVRIYTPNSRKTKFELVCERKKCKFINRCWYLSRLSQAIEGLEDQELKEELPTLSNVNIVVNRGRSELSITEMRSMVEGDGYEIDFQIDFKVGCQFLKRTSKSRLSKLLFERIFDGYDDIYDGDDEEEESDYDEPEAENEEIEPPEQQEVEVGFSSRSPNQVERLRRIVGDLRANIGFRHPVELVKGNPRPGALGWTDGETIFIPEKTLFLLGDGGLAHVWAHEETHINKNHAPQRLLLDSVIRNMFDRLMGKKMGLLPKIILALLILGGGYVLFSSLVEYQEDQAEQSARQITNRSGYGPSIRI
jgi:hypothetical protein